MNKTTNSFYTKPNAITQTNLYNFYYLQNPNNINYLNITKKGGDVWNTGASTRKGKFQQTNTIEFEETKDNTIPITQLSNVTTYVDHYRNPDLVDSYRSQKVNSRLNSALPYMTKSDLPLLPGLSFNNPDKDQFNKYQVFENKGKTCLEKNFNLPEHKESIQKEIRDVEESLKGFSTKGFQTTTNTFFNPGKVNIRNEMTIYNESYPRILPQWIKHDKNVLKFYGYFNEHVVETVHENYRSRMMLVNYYLSDDTIHIGEEKAENSGIVQGYFLKRQRLLQPIDKNDPYKKLKKKAVHWKDLNIGSNLEVYGKVLRLFDCDKFTRDYYNQNGIELNPPEEFVPPKKIEDITNIQANDGSTPESRRLENFQNIGEFKEYIEVKLKGGHPNKNLKQFLENDRKVLNFNILWYDEKYDKEEKPYIMNYYLADNTVEIREIKVNNSGKDPYPYLLRKSKLSKKPKFSYCPGLLKKENPEDFYIPKDLILGNYINIYNRPCLIYDCDEFTRQWYLKNLGVDMVPIRMKKNPPQQVIHPIPPHIGYGSEEDSLLSVYYLTPMSKIRDMIKMFKQDKHIMRYFAKLVSPLHSDPERNFIISVFCRDDSIQVYEVGAKNSGRQSCKFMERQKVKNPYTNLYYQPKDFIKGSDIYLNSYIFRLVECDEYTKKYMVDNPELFRDSDLLFVLNRLRKGSLKYKTIEDYCVEFIKTIDPDSQHYVDKNEIIRCFKE